MARSVDDELDDPKFPLSVSPGGKIVMEVTKIEKTTLDAALFSAPKGWEKMEMPAMPGRP